MEKKRNSIKSPMLLCIVLLLLAILTGIFTYRYNIEKNLTASSRATMDGIVAQQKFAFTSKLENQQRNIKTYASIFAHGEFSDQQIIDELTTIADNSTFTYATLASIDGESIENTGIRLNVSDREYFVRALAGETVISDPVISKVTNESIVNFATPVKKGNDVIGVLIGVYDTTNLTALLQPSFEGNGYTYIIANDGKIIVRTEANGILAVHSNLFDAFKDARFYNGCSIETIKANVLANKSGYCHYRYNGDKRLMHYAPLGLNNWSIFSVASESVITSQATDILRSTTIFAVCTIALFLLATLLFIMEQRKHVKELSEIAFVDGLTGAANRKKFKIQADELLRKKTNKYAFAIMDIDKFKVLNDSLGYACGDRLLICIADVLCENTKSHETFGRCDSDEFYLLLEYLDNDTVQKRVETIFAQVDTRFKALMDSSYNLVLCVGIYVIVDPIESINVIIDRAKHAQLFAKGHLVSSVSFYDEKTHERILREKVIENRMHDALENNEFKLYLQPKYLLSDETVCGAEALVRWSTGDSLILYPDQFIPVFEKNGFVTKLDMRMLEMSCAFIRKWIDEGVTPIPISINFSRLHLQNANFVDDIAEIVDKYNIPSNLIEVELTESTMLNNESNLINVLAHLHQHGFTLSMDDFGSGYSSLGLLKNLPVDTVKLDRTFFTQYNDLERAKTVISNMISMAKQLGIFTVAEGVETKEHIDLLYGLGCDIVQGYYYARPMPAVELNEVLRKNKPNPHDSTQ